jgi:hypothetical protein
VRCIAFSPVGSEAPDAYIAGVYVFPGLKCDYHAVILAISCVFCVYLREGAKYKYIACVCR